MNEITSTTVETTAVAAQSTTQAIASLASTKTGKIAVAVVATAVTGYALYKGAYKGAKWVDRKIIESLLNYKRKKNAEAAAKVA